MNTGVNRDFKSISAGVEVGNDSMVIVACAQIGLIHAKHNVFVIDQCKSFGYG
jgi:hypothetical protein